MAWMTARHEERTRREAWEAYTANALCAVAGAWGREFELYTDIIAGKQAQAADDRTGDEIIAGLLDQLGG